MHDLAEYQEDRLQRVETATTSLIAQVATQSVQLSNLSDKIEESFNRMAIHFDEVTDKLNKIGQTNQEHEKQIVAITTDATRIRARNKAWFNGMLAFVIALATVSVQTYIKDKFFHHAS